MQQYVKIGERVLDAASQLAPADPTVPVIPVILGEHHQHRQSLGEPITLAHRQLADGPQLGVHHAVQELGFPHDSAAPPQPEAGPVLRLIAPLSGDFIALPCNHVHHQR